ncbi:hypothetical protein Cgig2_012843 [Carnegiea gigantea]|uniref:Uncharacterized protein n=1 Tax=Carnegiea gigantea TaxID=171969 RepID=A0A9Q1K9S2_9CARY|nr:hypothetical protein Cgig2_012843 [Carnegiea gigantea]
MDRRECILRPMHGRRSASPILGKARLATTCGLLMGSKSKVVESHMGFSLFLNFYHESKQKLGISIRSRRDEWPSNKYNGMECSRGWQPEIFKCPKGTYSHAKTQLFSIGGDTHSWCQGSVKLIRLVLVGVSGIWVVKKAEDLDVRVIHSHAEYKIMEVKHQRHILPDSLEGFLQEKWCSHYPLTPNLNNLANELARWNKEVFGNLF